MVLGGNYERHPNHLASTSRTMNLPGATPKRKTARDRMLADLRKMAKPSDLPRPAKFPAKLSDFFRLVIKAKTRAVCTARFRRFLRKKGGRNSLWITETPPRLPGFKQMQTLLPKSAFGFVPGPLSAKARDKWATREIQRIKKA